MSALAPKLGAAEKHVAKELTDAITQSLAAARKLVDSLQAIELDDLEAVMLDSKAKDAVITLVPLVQRTAKDLQMMELTAVLAGIMVKKRKENAA